MRLLFIFTLTLLVSFSSVGQDRYDYDTTLKGGYSISFKTSKSLQYLYLKKGNKTITELSSTSIGLPYKNLGYVGADFTDFFVLVHSYGSGNPHNIELVNKSTGKNILKNGAAWIDADISKEFLLYSDKDVPGKEDKMILQNIRTGKKRYFDFPADIFDGPKVLNRISIGSLNDKQVEIKYETRNRTKTKVYNR